MVAHNSIDPVLCSTACFPAYPRPKREREIETRCSTVRENDREIRRSPLGIDYRTLRGVAGFSLQESDTGDGDGDGGCLVLARRHVKCC